MDGRDQIVADPLPPRETAGMDKQPTKRRGPIGWLKARTWMFWMLALLAFYLWCAGPVNRVAGEIARWYMLHTLR
jgi:hypothetical protein